MKNRIFLKRRIVLFGKRDDGSASIEFVLWMPTFMFLLMLAIDASLLFMNQSNYWSVSRDTARLVARHAMTAEVAQDYAEAKVLETNSHAEATVSIDGQVVTVAIGSPAAALTAFNIFSFASPFTIQAAVTQAIEPI